jgi:signal transduction histidine kinase
VEWVITQKNRNSARRKLSSGVGSRKALRASLLKISDMAEHIYIENLHERIDLHSRDVSVRKLVDTINTMIGRLENDVRKQSFFITDASHEMRTPIAVIKGYADLMDRWGKNNPKVVQESIDAIKAETERINSLIVSLLALARGDNIHDIKVKEIVSLNETAGDAIKEMSLIKKGANILLVENSQEKILGSYAMILQLLRLFLDNAIKYSNNETEPIHIIISGDDNNSYLSIKDFGIGINDEDLPYIFERFYRADKSRSSKIPGFGLGLAMAEMITRAHKASVTVYSEPDEGTEFIVSFMKYNANE